MKTYSIDFLDEVQAVRVVSHGVRSSDNKDTMVLDALAEAARRACRKFLVDDRGVDLRVAFIELYERPQQLKALGVKADMRVAIAYAATSPRAADYRFFEDVCTNNALPLVRVFADYDASLDWLRRG